MSSLHRKKSARKSVKKSIKKSARKSTRKSEKTLKKPKSVILFVVNKKNKSTSRKKNSHCSRCLK